MYTVHTAIFASLSLSWFLSLEKIGEEETVWCGSDEKCLKEKEKRKKMKEEVMVRVKIRDRWIDGSFAGQEALFG